MPPKAKKKQEAASKKAAQKKKEKVVEDKTFGLKNKNKSKKVQAHIQSVTRNVMNTGPGDRREEERKKREKTAKKQARKAAKQEQDALFGEALLAVQKKTTTKTKGTVEAKGRDHDDDEKKPGQSRAMKMMYQMDSKELEDRLKEDPNYVPTLEDEIETQRQEMVEKLKASGKKGTPVTPETFAAWQERKRKKRAEEAKKLVEAEMKKKKGGKGLSVLSGRDLYEYKRDLFKDDDEAMDGIAEEEEDGEKRPAAEAERTDSSSAGEEKKSADGVAAAAGVEEVAEMVQSDLFLEGDDDDLDDLDDLDED
mmetsp:Transcript_20165/g.40848  ORF Transcript_20165/g.40848 Transcript_20165/m.40848 type:complete len:309 (-) Transcript_20165:237-1163(-)|eukprot:CAMPEP_0183293280 /NCGR_PEP_ID=MMETSP0160_2-20130417/2023_1 /TAXON_ID=2839 ORGANISM="Odontella Sinensis, Strain Grunow 1884" /NCGR_SAMPLE_ID=MMETSP0160_2 /ASSEMBLY_ACC=CAM_ASM_000250 /LENGTH=308 /DNA_ID=CAMNT_0025454367 /DNA_START=150 /DNA_END=1076 /DNA_ORIENTATION=+